MGPNRPSPIKNDYFCLKVFVPKYMQKAFLQKCGTHKKKERQFIKIQQYVKTNVTLAAGIALQDWQIKAGFKLVSLSQIKFLPVVFMSSLSQYLFCMYSNSLKPCSAIYVVGKANINNFTFSYSSGNQVFYLTPKPSYPCALKIARASSSLCRSISIFCMAE